MDPSHPVHLPGFLHALEPALNQYGYLAVAGLVLLEDFGVPVPGETVLILGAVYAGTGRLEIWLVGLLAFLAAVIGDNIGFAIGHFGGRALVERFGRYIFLTKERVDKAGNFFERQGNWIIIVARFIEGLRQANGIIAGISGMHWARFLAFNAIGAALWVGVWTTVGYFAGNNITSIYNTITHYTLYVAIAIVVAILAWVGWRGRRSRRGKPEKPKEEARPAETPANPDEQPRREADKLQAPERRKAQSPAAPERPKAQSPEAPERPKAQSPHARERPKAQSPQAPERRKAQSPEAPERPKAQSPAAPEDPKAETPERPERREADKP